MKKLCNDCKTRFEVPINDLEDGDAFSCPECGLEYTIVFEGNKITLVESKKLEMDDEDFELDEDEDYS
jgi:hydrogenase maturation factor HypF (carbamoyltransferase family)